ncbi:MAG: hypothetical protein PVF49_12735 [Anaerolineales bacterium]
MSVVKSYHIRSYKVQFYNPLIMNWFGVEAEIVSIIECFEDEEGHWGDGKYMCRLYFLTEDSEMPPSFHQPQNYAGGIFMRANVLGPVLDVLRNEKPVSIYLSSQHPENNMIYTGLEPIGEEEGRDLFFRK